MLNYKEFDYEKTKTVEIGTTLTREYWVKDKYCVKSFKIGRGRTKYTVYKDWNKENKTGREISRDIDKNIINDFLNDYIKFEEE